MMRMLFSLVMVSPTIIDLNGGFRATLVSATQHSDNASDRDASTCEFGVRSFATELVVKFEGPSDANRIQVTLLQLNGTRISADAEGTMTAAAHLRMQGEPASCHQYRTCGRYRPWLSCQCNSKCKHFHNCCHDYETVCLHVEPAPSKPHDFVKSTMPPFGHPRDGFKYPEHRDFTLWLVEEFDDPLHLDSDPIWTWSDGGLSEGQVRFAKEQIKFGDGKLKIEVREGSPSTKPQRCSHAEAGEVQPKPLTSGEIRTRYNQFRYGRYEVRMKAPSVNPGKDWVDGNFIATMFVYRDGKYKHWREIDFEITGDSKHSVTTNVLVANDVWQWAPGIQASGHKEYLNVNTRNKFHTYVFEWLPDRITWSIDGTTIREHRSDSGISVPEMSAKIIMNLWVFNNMFAFGGSDGKNNRYPMQVEYDWFRFYRWDGDKHYPCAGMSDACLTASDKYLSGNNPCDGIQQLGRLPWGSAACTARCL
eukprot:TRINITY_DN73814_c0_g1_i1.p1 TRINITY_DN73814_c0_g1~~TRINITY_DN73814_c0_g1_i1.p1  ORF type:complete len:477 (+),score=61.70 TRINITY_DN73814_c0_g1_i1:64-1494(+)